jgi:hypothetical protein
MMMVFPKCRSLQGRAIDSHVYITGNQMKYQLSLPLAIMRTGEADTTQGKVEAHLPLCRNKVIDLYEGDHEMMIM